MAAKKRIHFYQLCAVFAAITVISLMFNWGNKSNIEAGSNMMGQSMGSMMASMHLKNVTIEELLSQKSEMQGMADMSSHHNKSFNFITFSHYITTGTIIILLPFIIAGSIFIAILWIK